MKRSRATARVIIDEGPGVLINTQPNFGKNPRTDKKILTAAAVKDIVRTSNNTGAPSNA